MTATLGPNTLYKVLEPNRMPHHGGSGQWPEPGEWLEIPGPLVMCRNALHLCRELDLIYWLGPEIWVVEAGGEIVEHGDKVGTLRARLVSHIETWNTTTARLFAADCAERVLPIFERARPNDFRPREAIAVARAYARGAIDDAARNVAGRAADAVERAAIRHSAAAAARAATWAVAGSVAWPAAATAARAASLGDSLYAEREWQTQRLMQYLRGEVR